MKNIIELALVAVVVVSSASLETTQFVLSSVAVVCLYLYTMHNSFNDGYEAALEDRVY